MAGEGDQDRRIEEFHAALRGLRQAAGKPSLRTMAGRVHYSHTALAGVAAGGRLASLDLTLAFVRACGGDIEEWRARWKAVDAEINHPVEAARTTRRPPWLVLAVILVAAAASAGTALIVLGRPPHRVPASRQAAGTPPVTATTARGSPSPDPPLVPGDDDEFVADITIPDGTTVQVNQHFVKTWAIRNTGTVTWRDRYLERQGPIDAPGLCTSVSRVPVPVTLPGQEARISVTFTAPSAPGSCRADWKMTDGNGHNAFPGKGGLYLLVNVDR